MRHREDYFSGHDRLPLFEQAWLPSEPPRAGIVLIHGLIEHSGQHAHTALELVRQGYSVHAMDLRGHGRSEGSRCDVQSFEHYLLDLDIFFEQVRRESGDRPLFLLGNSMGGLLVALWSVLRRAQISGLILSGPLLALADGFFPRLRHLVKYAAALAPDLRVTRIPLEWLARELQVVDRFRNDPLVFHGCFTVRVAAEIFRAIRQVSAKAAALDVPLLILQGSQDRICGPAGSQAFYEKAGSKDKTYRLYEGFYHEVFDESPRDRVLTDLTTWLDQRSPEAGVPACPHEVET